MPPDLQQLDVTDPANGGAVQAALDGVGSVDPSHEPFVRRVADECPDRLLSGQARVLLAAFEQARGRATEAADLYRAGLPAVWGSGTRAEANALINYAAVCVTQRRSFEGLALLRRACDFAEERDNTAALALAKAYLARTLVELEDWERLDPLLAEIDALLENLEPGPRAYVEMVAVKTAIEAAFRRGDAESARACSPRLDTLTLGDDPRVRPFFRSLIMATLGQRAEAREQIATVRGMGEGRESYATSLLAVEIDCFEPDTEPAEWCAAGDALLDLLEEEHERHSAGDRMIIAGRLSRRLADIDGAEDVTRRADEVAAAGVIERIAELERFLRALPQLCFAVPADQEILDDYRARFLARHDRLLDIVRRRLGGDPEGAPRLDTLRRDGDLWLCVCAWCGLLRGPDGLWLPVDQLNVPPGPVQITHGICQRCRDRELRLLRRDR